MKSNISKSTHYNVCFVYKVTYFVSRGFYVDALIRLYESITDRLFPQNSVKLPSL